MKFFVYVLVFNIILVLLQATFLPEFFGPYINPNLILAFGASFLFLNQEKKAYESVLIGGLALDLIGFSIVGSSSLLMVAILLILFYLKKYISRGWLFNVLLIMVANITYFTIISSFNYKLIIGSILTALCVYIFLVVNKSLVSSIYEKI